MVRWAAQRGSAWTLLTWAAVAAGVTGCAHASARAPAAELEALSTSEIMEVILSSKDQLSECVAEQHQRDPSLTGKLLMRWTVRTDGTTTDIGVASAHLEGTYIAACMGDVIREMRFPPHRRAHAPIVFPFKF